MLEQREIMQRFWSDALKKPTDDSMFVSDLRLKMTPSPDRRHLADFVTSQVEKSFKSLNFSSVRRLIEENFDKWNWSKIR